MTPADFLMMEIIAEGNAVSRDRLEERLRRFERLAVLRPDGYLALVSTGYPVQCVGPIPPMAVVSAVYQSSGFGRFMPREKVVLTKDISDIFIRSSSACRCWSWASSSALNSLPGVAGGVWGWVAPAAGADGIACW